LSDAEGLSLLCIHIKCVICCIGRSSELFHTGYDGGDLFVRLTVTAEYNIRVMLFLVTGQHLINVTL